MDRREIAKRGFAFLMGRDAALSTPTDVTGEILRVDPANQTITLTDGRYYHVAASLKLENFQAGEQVTITVEKSRLGADRALAIVKSV